MTIEYDLVMEDFIAYNLHFMHTSEACLRQLRAYRLTISLVPSILFCAGITIALSNPVAGIATAIVSFVVFWFLSPWVWWRAVRRNVLRMARNNGLGEPGTRQLFADDRGLRQESANGETFQLWSGVSRIEETPGHAFIYIGPVQAFVIPKRIGEREVSAFLANVRQHCPNRG